MDRPALSRAMTTAAAAALVASYSIAPSAQKKRFDVVEATVADIHAAMKAKQLTCHALVQEYLARIDAYDKQGPALNAIVVVNPDALKEADALDTQYARTARSGPLHCVPMIVKDNFETIGLQSAAGSLSMKGFVSDKDAFLVKRVKAAGAIVLAKSNMAEFAFSPYETVNSILRHHEESLRARSRPGGIERRDGGGDRRELRRRRTRLAIPATRSAGRPRTTHSSGIRSTMGLTSRAGVIPLSYLADIAGPMARTVGRRGRGVPGASSASDPEDPVTAARQRSSGARLLEVARRDRPEGRAHRHPPSGVRARAHPESADAGHAADRSGSGRGVRQRDRGTQKGGRNDRRSRAAWIWPTCAADRDRTAAAASSTTSTSIWRRRATACRCIRSTRSSRRASSTRRSPARSRAPQRGTPQRPDSRRVQGRRRVPHGLRRRGHQGDGRAASRRVRVSDVEFSAAAHRRSAVARRRQQPGVLADVRLPRDQRPDGLHARTTPCRRG